MSSRESTDAVIDEWAKTQKISGLDLKELKRNVAVVKSTPQLIMRADSRIKMEVGKAQAYIERYGPVRGANFWLNKTDMPYWMQKCVQWFVSEAYSAGKRDASDGK